MTLSEFKAWMDGYTAAGGKDVKLIKETLDQVMELQIPWYQPPTWSPWITPITTSWTWTTVGDTVPCTTSGTVSNFDA